MDWTVVIRYSVVLKWIYRRQNRSLRPIWYFRKKPHKTYNYQEARGGRGGIWQQAKNRSVADVAVRIINCVNSSQNSRRKLVLDGSDVLYVVSSSSPTGPSDPNLLIALRPS